MERKEFLNLVGISVGAVILQNCLSGCSKASEPAPAVTTPPTNGGGTPTTGGGTSTTSGFTGNNSIAKGTIDFTLDISDKNFADLATNGKALISGDIIVARTKTGDFLALAKACTHQGTTIDFVADKTSFNCSNHNSNFDASGNVISGPASSPLKSYKTSFDSKTNILKIS